MIDRRHLLRGGAALGLTVALPARARADDGRPGGDPFRIGALTPITGAVATGQAPQHLTDADLRALITLVNAEFERRLQLAKATIAAMQSP